MGARALVVVCLLNASCGKELNPKFCAAHPDDERCAGVALDATTSNESMIAHLDSAIVPMLTSTADVTVTTATIIDTAAATITPEMPGVVVIASTPQLTGPNVMVIQANSFAFEAPVDVFGDKPLVIVATTTIRLAERLDAAADDYTAGPGGFGPGMGDGAGEDGGGGGAGSADAGGGGGSYGTPGGAGGNVGTGQLAGVPGVVHGSAAVLVGGSGGGLPSMPGSCTLDPGAGGGAVQLTAFGSITLASPGGVNVGGGGGDGGEGCGSHGSGGAGGGAGGMIYLQAPLLEGDGHVSANGGGGGEGAGSAGGLAGTEGGDAGFTSGGGAGGGGVTNGGDGGAGCDGTNAAGAGGAVPADYNAGGGGGGCGRIYYDTSGPRPSYTDSPAASGV